MLTWHFLLILLVTNSGAASNNFVENDQFLSLNEDIRLLRDENKNQNMEIALLKEMFQSQDRRVHEKIITEIEQRMKYDEASMAEEHQYPPVRQKRPFRLIPVQKEKFDLNEHNENSIILNKNQKTTIFYGPPNNCSDLSRLGYTLNGYYLVKPDASNEVRNLKGIYCAFKQPKGSNIDLSKVLENPIGVFKPLRDSIKSEPFSYIISSGRGSITNEIPSSRMVNLVNSLGKCATVTENGNTNNYPLIQWDCNEHEKGMLWSWNETTLGSGNRNLCNGHGKCAASPNNSPFNVFLIQWDKTDEAGQKFNFLYSSARPGFYLVKNDHGKCLDAAENLKGAAIGVSDCNDTKAGQLWKWNQLNSF